MREPISGTLLRMPRGINFFKFCYWCAFVIIIQNENINNEVKSVESKLESIERVVVDIYERLEAMQMRSAAERVLDQSKAN